MVSHKTPGSQAQKPSQPFHQKDLTLSKEVGQGDLERIRKGIEAVSVDGEQVV